MLKVLQAQQYVNGEIPDVQAGFQRSKGPRDQIANLPWIMKKAREFQENIYFIYYVKALTVWITTNEKILKEMGVSDHLTCFLRNLYAGQETTVRTGCETIDWFKIGKGVQQRCILSPCLFNLYAGYII